MRYAIDEEVLTSLGDVIREKKGEEKYFKVAWFDGIVDFTNTDVFPDVWRKVNVDKDWLLDVNIGEYIYCISDRVNSRGFNITYPIVVDSDALHYNADGTGEYGYINNGGYFKMTQFLHDKIANGTKIAFRLDDVYQIENGNYLKIYLDREGGINPETTYTPEEMVEEVSNLNIIPKFQFGNISNFYSQQINKWALSQNKVEFNNINGASNAFANYDQDDFPYDITFMTNGTTSISVMFNSAKFKTFSGKLINLLSYGNGFYAMFQNCNNLRELPEITGDINNMPIHNSTSADMENIFSACYSLRRVPESLLKELWSKHANYGLMYNGFNNCYVLDEIVGFPIQRNTSNLTSNRFTNTATKCSRIKRFVFDMDNGTPYVYKASNQVFDLSQYVGYANSTSNITGYNSGLTTATQITDAASYEALKNNEDSWTLNINYSRYNHASAVETINSLPDCHATGTNTIKFKGAAGSATDGGAINTLTADEIAIATAKGWTVTMVA